MDEFQPKEAVPTSAEIKCFQNLWLIPVECFECALQRLTHYISAGDNVKIIEGGAQGAIGAIYNIIGKMATVDINNEDVQLTVSIDWLRKAINIGDEVVVAYGDQQGFTDIYFDNTSNRSNIDASRLKKDLNLRFLGRHVHVIGQHCLKNYEGIIKTTLRDNDVLVELKATSTPRISTPLESSPSLLVPPPSVEGAEAGMENDPFVNIPPNNISPLPGADIPLSALPLTALTPLPPSMSVSLTPAWNPSS
ncbi:hypothetical protein C0995_009076 [Termitomyces sp. Mi166|nr:hypothetical protein C0995_009076 [Termitomyces sp. Mi166\